MASVVQRYLERPGFWTTSLFVASSEQPYPLSSLQLSDAPRVPNVPEPGQLTHFFLHSLPPSPHSATAQVDPAVWMFTLMCDLMALFLNLSLVVPIEWYEDLKRQPKCYPLWLSIRVHVLFKFVLAMPITL
jgi:hypothetical protein